MTELPGDPFGRLAGRKPQRRRGVAHLVRAPAALQTQMAQKRKPDTVGEVLVVDRLAFAVAEDVLTELAGGFVLIPSMLRTRVGSSG
jgi:hypothetical protein